MTSLQHTKQHKTKCCPFCSIETVYDTTTIPKGVTCTNNECECHIPPDLHPLTWFTGRIGKKIYRDTVDCKCSGCTDGTENGILVHDKDHAEYLYNVQLDMDIRYRARK